MAVQRVEQHVDLDVIGSSRAPIEPPARAPHWTSSDIYEVLLAPLRRSPVYLIGSVARRRRAAPCVERVSRAPARSSASIPARVARRRIADGRRSAPGTAVTGHSFPPSAASSRRPWSWTAGPHRPDEVQSVFEHLFPRLLPAASICSRASACRPARPAAARTAYAYFPRPGARLRRGAAGQQGTAG